jgi:hypothetical protein
VNSRLRYIVCATTLPVVAVALVVAGPARAMTTEDFHATFHDVAFQNSCTPPIVFCGSGVVAGYGPATTVVRVTRNVPIPGTSCNDVAGIRSISLDDGSGTFVSTFTGRRCPLGNGGHANRVEFDWIADPNASSGVFALTTGTGTGVNTTAGNVQVVSLTGTITP